ncbi:hypothetical protein Zmor_026241 [Zophobas morio]|uniref:Uncharacterized protein n=1 Tax=Zophobas morio TaxID=2755281 RepID=A0AA38M517_9CUCU|nr:hypothetical protein Zmor_026241 [Zophobas morio]
MDPHRPHIMNHRHTNRHILDLHSHPIMAQVLTAPCINMDHHRINTMAQILTGTAVLHRDHIQDRIQDIITIRIIEGVVGAAVVAVGDEIKRDNIKIRKKREIIRKVMERAKQAITVKKAISLTLMSIQKHVDFLGVASVLIFSLTSVLCIFFFNIFVK